MYTLKNKKFFFLNDAKEEPFWVTKEPFSERFGFKNILMI